MELRCTCDHHLLLAKVDLAGIWLHCRGCRQQRLLSWAKILFLALQALTQTEEEPQLKIAP